MKHCIKGDERCPCLYQEPIAIGGKEGEILVSHKCSLGFDNSFDEPKNCTVEIIQISYSDKSESEAYIP